MTKRSILVIDDEPVILDAVCRVAGALDIETTPAADGDAAISAFDSAHFDAVLTDLMLPKRSGTVLMAHFLAKCPDLPVVVMTGYATIGTAATTLLSGGFDYVPKPFEPAELKGVLKRVTAEKSPLEELSGARHFGCHAWVKQENGAVRVGPGSSFGPVLGEVRCVEYVREGTLISRGEPLVHLAEENGAVVHTVWAPMSGRVLLNNPFPWKGEVNRDIWFSVIEPNDFDSEWLELR